jgi:succinate dehydrogenase / fumarate reductase cytochrome b subunit
MKEVFASPVVLVIYLVGVISLFWHLIHGFSSAFQTIGLNSPKYNAFIRNAGYAYTIIICLAFALMPISIHFGWLQ